MKYFKHVIAYLLTIIMLISLMPAARATSNDSVIESISLGHTSPVLVTTSVEPSSARYITLHVQYGYSDSVTFDLKNDIKYTVDLTAYKSVVITPASDTISITKDTDNSYVKLAVTFNLSSESDSDINSATDYYIRVVKDTQIASVFLGVISKEISLTSSSPDFSTAIISNYKPNDGKALDHIIINGSNTNVGQLTFPGGLTFGSEISSSLLSGLSFVPSICGMESYNITAYDTAGTAVGIAVLTITVYTKPSIKSEISEIVYLGTTKTFSASDFTNNCELYNAELKEIEITPDETTAGTWYVNGAERPAGTKTITVAASDISTISFKGTAAGTVTFTWNAKNADGYADADGSGVLTVLAATLTLSSYTSPIGILKGDACSASTSNFSYTPSEVTMTYLKIVTVPVAADGYICLTSALAKNDSLGYPAIAANTALKAGTIIPYNYINCISLVSKSTSTGAYISFTWLATSDSTLKSAVWASVASYTVYFKAAGTVNYTTQKNVPVILSASDFSSQYLMSTGYTLSCVTFTLPAATAGKLWYNYNTATKTGTAVTAATKYYSSANPNISNLTLVPYTDYSGTVSIIYNAYKSDGTYIAGTVCITISDNIGGTVSYTIDKNDWVRFDAADFTKSFQDSTGKKLSYVKFTLPSSTYGKLYYNYVSSSNFDSDVSSSTNYYIYSSSYLSYVAFASAKNYTGTIVISFTGYGADGTGYSGKIIIFIVDSPAGTVSYNCKANSSILLSGGDIVSEFISVTGSVMSYVLIAPPAATIGTLYYNYSTDTKTGTKVTASTKYFSGASPDISSIVFVPAADYVGKADIKYTVYTAAGVAYIGKLKITVGEASAGTVSLSTKTNTAIKFSATSFSNAFYLNSGESTLSYVTFTLPSTTYGVLYYNYASSNAGTAVATDTKYYIGSTPYISNITFVPKSGYSGSFAITFTGYTADGSPYSGKIQINVGNSNGTIYYSTATGDSLTFSSADFISAYFAVFGSSLSYVRFNPPSSSYGTLYYGYASSTSYTPLVYSYTNYYCDSYPNISNITFVPDSSYTGTFSMSYTGYDKNGNSFTGTVIISVTARDGGTVRYKTDNETAVTLDSADFNSAFIGKTGSSLYYVKFVLPSSSYGQLNYQYVSPTSYVSSVSASTNYYRSSSPLLSDVTFVPNSSYTGTVTISYTAYTTAGVAYAGQLLITVNDANAYPFTDVQDNYSWARNAILYLYKNDIVIGSGDGLYNPGGDMTRGDFLLTVYRAFNLTSTASDNFSDVPTGSYYYNAIAVAKALGITQGSGGKFHPDASISRQDAMVIIMRALVITGNPLAAGSSTDLSGYSDNDEISSYASDAAAALVNAGIVKGSNGYLSPLKMIRRAEMAVILYNVLSK